MASYDSDIAFLIKYPEMLPKAWYDPSGEPGGSLFQYLGPEGDLKTYSEYGCPTMVKHGVRSTALPEMTEAIKKDVRIPENIPTREQTTLETLEAFKGYQRWADRTFRSVTPKCVCARAMICPIHG